ncbi:beta-ketoadipate pathway transcriptional regulator, PcaR/PcaU/PobR family [compost metagenome]
MYALRPTLASAVLQLGETATLAMLDGDTIVPTIQVQSRHALRTTMDIRNSPAHETAAGRVLLSQLTDDRLKRTLARVRSRELGTSDEDYRHKAMAAIRQIQEDGYSIDDREPGLRCYAVPVVGVGRPVVISVDGSADRLGDGLDGRVITVLQQTAQTIAEGLKLSLSSDVNWPGERNQRRTIVGPSTHDGIPCVVFDVQAFTEKGRFPALFEYNLN